MPNLIRLSQSSIGEEEKRSVHQVLTDGYLGMGREVQLFERELEEFFSNKVKIACVNTGTSALQLALQSCGVGVGDEVIIPSITYVASFQATSATGATPIACDIELSTGCLDIRAAKNKITKKTKAIMYVHYASGVGDRKGVFELANQYGLRVIEDAAHSFGGYDNGLKIGSDVDILCFSFDGIKNITCAEGGAVVSGDQNIIEKIKDLRLLGVSKDTEKRYAGQRSWDFEVKEQGWRYHLSNINAAIGRVQLRRLEEFSKKRQSLSKLYVTQLQELPIRPLNINFQEIVPHIFPVWVSDKIRDNLRIFLQEHQVETGVHYKPNHLLKKYRSTDCLNAEKFGNSILSLPMHVMLNDSDVKRVVNIIKSYFEST